MKITTVYLMDDVDINNNNNILRSFSAPDPGLSPYYAAPFYLLFYGKGKTVLLKSAASKLWK